MGVVGVLRATMWDGIICGLLHTVKHWIWSSRAKTPYISLAMAHHRYLEVAVIFLIFAIDKKTHNFVACTVFANCYLSLISLKE